MAGGTENLKTPTHAEAVERGRKGGLANAKRIKQTQTLKQVLNAWKDEEPTEKEKMILKNAGFKLDEITNISQIAYSIITEAKKGNMRAIELIYKLSGEDQREEQEIKRLKEENKLLKIKQEILKNPANAIIQGYEDLNVLNQLLNFKNSELNEIKEENN